MMEERLKAEIIIAIVKLYEMEKRPVDGLTWIQCQELRKKLQEVIL